MVALSPTTDRVKRLLGRSEDSHRNTLNLARVTGAVEDMEDDNLEFYEDILKSNKKTHDLLKGITKHLKKIEQQGGTSMLEALGAAYGAKGLLRGAGGLARSASGGAARGGWWTCA
jgi:hypothetical protein